jgi:hypothetical protein
MLGVLEIIFRRDRIAGGLRVARELKIFLGDMIGRAANLHVGAVRFINPRQRVLIAAVLLLLLLDCYCARACACCDGADADRFSWLVFNDS